MTTYSIGKKYTSHLFNNVYYKQVYRNTSYSPYLIKKYEFYHDCGTDHHPMYIKLYQVESGTCSKCNTYILPYKKLQVMASLKDLYT